MEKLVGTTNFGGLLLLEGGFLDINELGSIVFQIVVGCF